MKVWGYRAFENEAAVKWLHVFFFGRNKSLPGSREPVEQVFEMFGEWGRRSPTEYASAEVVAACEFLAALCGRPGEQTPSLLLESASAVKGKVRATLIARGLKYLERIATHSELAERWQPTPYFVEWQVEIAGLIRRLR